MIKSTFAFWVLLWHTRLNFAYCFSNPLGFFLFIVLVHVQVEERGSDVSEGDNPLQPTLRWVRQHCTRHKHVHVDFAPAKVEEQEPLLALALTHFNSKADAAQQNEVECHNQNSEGGCAADGYDLEEGNDD